MSDQQQGKVEPVREGSRWLHARPSSEAVAEWFEGQALHHGMRHAPYVSGLVLIGAKEKVTETRYNSQGNPYAVEFEIPVYTPYVKVDTRVRYFWDYVRGENGGRLSGDYVGVIEPVEQEIIRDEKHPFFNANLPKGYTTFAVRNRDDSVTRYVVCTMAVSVYERGEYAQKLKGNHAIPVLRGEDSKQTAILNRRGWADDFSIMKARTGAIGRALGVAGMLTVGTGVATAEDMQEMLSGEAQGGAVNEEKPVTLPSVVAPSVEATAGNAPTQALPDEPQASVSSDEDMREQYMRQFNALRVEMRSDHPEAMDTFTEWWRSREYGKVEDLTTPQLKGAVTKLSRDLDSARRSSPAQAGDPA